MLNLFYRGHLIHKDIPSICYTVFGCRPGRAEVGSRSTALAAMRLVDGRLSRQASERARALWLKKGQAAETREAPAQAAFG